MSSTTLLEVSLKARPLLARYLNENHAAERVLILIDQRTRPATASRVIKVCSLQGELGPVGTRVKVGNDERDRKREDRREDGKREKRG